MARECPWFWRGLCVFLPQVTWVQSCACLSGENCTGMTHSHSRRAQRRHKRKCRARVPASPSTDDLPLRARPVDDLCNRRNTWHVWAARHTVTLAQKSVAGLRSRWLSFAPLRG